MIKKQKAILSIAIMQVALFLSGCSSSDNVTINNPITPQGPRNSFTFSTQYAQNDYKNLFSGLYTLLNRILTPAATIAVAICGIILITSPDPKSVDNAKSWLKNIVIGIMIYKLTPGIVMYFTTLLDPSSTWPFVP